MSQNSQHIYLLLGSLDFVVMPTTFNAFFLFFSTISSGNHFQWDYTLLLCVHGNIFVFIALQTFSIWLFTIWQKNSVLVWFFLCSFDHNNNNNIHIFRLQSSMNIMYKMYLNILSTWSKFWLTSIRQNRYIKMRCDGPSQWWYVCVIEVIKKGKESLFIFKRSKSRKYLMYILRRTHKILPFWKLRFYHSLEFQGRRRKKKDSIYKVDFLIQRTKSKSKKFLLLRKKNS